MAAVTALVASIAVVVEGARTLVGRLRDLAERAEEVEARVRDDPAAHAELAELERRMNEAEAAEAVAGTRVEEVLARIAEISRRLDELRSGRRLYDFLAERAASSDFPGRLGVVSLVRRDFEQLVKLEATGGGKGGAASPAGRSAASCSISTTWTDVSPTRW